jgi:Phage integrase, N-terminal SAM-like domain
MTRLRKMMLEELERRNYSEATTRCYVRTVEDFSRRFKRSPDCLGPEHIREYQAELFKKRKLSPGCGFSGSFTQGFSLSFTHPRVLILGFYQLFSLLAIADRFIRLNERGAPPPYQELEPERGRRSRTRSEVRAKRREVGSILDGRPSGGYRPRA